MDALEAIRPDAARNVRHASYLLPGSAAVTPYLAAFIISTTVQPMEGDVPVDVEKLR